MRKAGRIVQRFSGQRIMFLEPYTSALLISSNNVSTKTKEANPQNLPRLPIPKLEDTLKKYLETVKPFLSPEELDKTTKIVYDFGSIGGPGQKLQALLEKRAGTHINWLEDWWLSTAYLGYRDPVVVHSSPGLVFPFRQFQNQLEQLHYAAKTLLAAFEYKDLIDNNKIPVEMMGKNPLDMGQYKKVFGTCRIPATPQDKLSYNNCKHITVVHNNHFFQMDVFGNDNQLLSEEQIVQQLKNIIDQSQTPSPTPVGILTSEHRDKWAKAYEILVQDSSNRASLGSVERSVVVLCLDAAAGLACAAANKSSRQNLAAEQTIHGGGARANGANRWFDKTIQFIVGADGVTGLTYEHSPAEGQPIAVLTDYILDYIEKNKTSTTCSSAPKSPIKLEFNVNSDVACMIEDAKVHLDNMADDLDLECFTFADYGKDFIKSHKMSPDSFLQMAMQYAFYKVHGVAGAHYESAATRMFAGGRTETIRSCSPASVAFARAMLAPAPLPERRAALRAAVDAHRTYTAQALQGLGVDRHLLGLKLTALENGMELPDLYKDAGFTRSTHMRISTSQVALRADGFMCYGPLVRDGYATCYNPRARDVNFATSAFRDERADLPAYRAALHHALTDMAAVLTAAKL